MNKIHDTLSHLTLGQLIKEADRDDYHQDAVYLTVQAHKKAVGPLSARNWLVLPIDREGMYGGPGAYSNAPVVRPWRKHDHSPK